MIDQILCGNCLELIGNLKDDTLDGIVSDPPFGEGMGYDGDTSIATAESLLTNCLKLVEPKLKRNAHVAIFWTMRNLDVLIDLVRSVGLHYRRTLAMYIPRGNARPYLGWLPRTQAIVIAQKYLPKKPSEFHEDMAVYLSKAIEAKGCSKGELANKINCDSRLIMKWTRVGDPAWCLPTPRFYKPLKELLSLDDQFDVLLTREPSNSANQRDDFPYKHDCYVVEEDRETEMFHPSQKPLSVVEHLVQCVAPKDGVVLDPFCGSGTTCVAAKKHKRHFIGFEISEKFCEIARKRLDDVV